MQTLRDVQDCHQRLSSAFDLLLFFLCSLITTLTLTPPPNNALLANLDMYRDTGRPLAQDCLAPLIDSPTRHHTNTGTHSSSLWLSFLAIVQQGRALERTFVVLNGTSTHCHTYWKYTGSLQSGHLFTWDTLDDMNGVRITEVPLYTIHVKNTFGT